MWFEWEWPPIGLTLNAWSKVGGIVWEGLGVALMVYDEGQLWSVQSQWHSQLVFFLFPPLPPPISHCLSISAFLCSSWMRIASNLCASSRAASALSCSAEEKQNNKTRGRVQCSLLAKAGCASVSFPVHHVILAPFPAHLYSGSPCLWEPGLFVELYGSLFLWRSNRSAALPQPGTPKKMLL